MQLACCEKIPRTLQQTLLQAQASTEKMPVDG